MNDTSEAMQARYRAMLRRLSPEERIKMACGMYETARALMRAGIRQQKGIEEGPELAREIFLRLYGHEFSEPHRSRIVVAVVRAAEEGVNCGGAGDDC